MEQMKIRDIVEAAGGQLLCGDPEMEITGFSIDSRQGGEHDLFVPIIGEKVDAHRFIEGALKRNGATLTSEHETMESDQPWIKVEDTVKAMQKIGTAYRNRLDLPVIAVTGSVGKTTTREMIAWALASQKKVFQTMGNQNSQIGVPLTLSRMTREDEVAVLEIGMSERGQIETLTRMIRPNIAVVTVIGVCHIEYLKSQENICLEKMDIVKGLQEGGKVFLNGDDPFLLPYKGKLDYETYLYGMGEDCDYRAVHVIQEEQGMSFDLIVPGGQIYPVRLHVLGEHNVKNALAALGICHQSGLNVEEAAKALTSFQGQRQNIVCCHGYTLIEDAYNASPDSMEAALKVLAAMEGRRIAVLADMLELGDKEKDFHEKVGVCVGTLGIDELYCVGPLSVHIMEGTKKSHPACRMRHFDDNDALADFLEEYLQEGDRVLIKGSNGMKLSEVIRRLKQQEEKE